MKVVHDGPKSTPHPISNYCVTDSATDCERHRHRRGLISRFYETNSYWPTLSSLRRCGEQRKLPSGANPIGHVRLNRQLMTALVATGLQNGATSASSHSGTKAVGLCPLSLIWLISTLHKILISNCFDALRGTSWRSLARYWEQSYPSGDSPPAKNSKWVYGDSPDVHEGHRKWLTACG